MGPRNSVPCVAASGVARNLRHGVRKLVLPSLPFPSPFPFPTPSLFLYLSIPFPLPPLRSRPLKIQLEGLGEHCKLQQYGAEAEIKFDAF